MPFVRISRDKRGYENFYLVHTPPVRRGKTRQRILYWFRTPPNVKVGRVPFDEAVMRALEARHPDVTFDWDALRSTPMPMPSAEHWRERRRVERGMRQFRDADEEREPPVVDGPPVAEAAQADSQRPLPEQPESGASTAAASPEPTLVDSTPEIAEANDGPSPPGEATSPRVASDADSDPRRRRRRRRGRRGRPAVSPQGTDALDLAPSTEIVPSSAESASDEPFDDEPGGSEE